MARKCCVVGCNSRKDMKPNTTFHGFPKNTKVREEWLETLRLQTGQEILPTEVKNKEICGLHFEPKDYHNYEDYYESARRSKCLRTGSVPSIFPDPLEEPLEQITTDTVQLRYKDILPRVHLENRIEKITTIQKDEKCEEDLITIIPQTTTSSNLLHICQVCESADELIDITEESNAYFYEELQKIKCFQDQDDQLSTILKYICRLCGNKLEEISAFRNQYELTYKKLTEKTTIPTENVELDLKMVVETEDLMEEQEIFLIPITSPIDDSSVHLVHLIKEGNDWTISDANDNEELNKEENAQHKESPGDPLKPNMYGPRECIGLICNICNKYYATKQSLQNHNRKVHEPRREYKCSICLKIFTNASKLKKHMTVHEPVHEPKKRNGPRECNVCHKMFQNSYTWEMHRITHNTSRLICKICKKKFSHINNVIRHVKTVHEKKRDYKCSICSKSYTQSTQLKKHILVHSTTRVQENCTRESCDQCFRTFKNPISLKIHKYTHIPVAEQTEEMKKTLSKKKMHKKYMQKRQKCTERICTVCGKVVAQHALDGHMRLHTGEKPFECAICGKCFRLRSILNTHMYQHTGEKPYKCKMCNAAFRQSIHLSTHMKLHTGEKPHKCTICGKDFREKCNLIEHTRVHTGEKPFHCRICPKKFITARVLRDHYRKIHFTGEDLRTPADIQRKLDEVLKKDVPLNE